MSATSLDLSQIKTDALSSASTFRSLIGLGTSDTPTFKSLTLTSGAITTNVPVWDATATWNNAATTFTGLRLNVTDTASNASSLLMDLQVGGSSRFKVSKSGNIQIANGPWLVGSTDTTQLRIAINEADVIGRLLRASAFVAGDNNANRARVGSTGLVLDNTGLIRFTNNSSDTYLSIDANNTAIYSDAANTLAQRNSTNAQTFRIYNTYTDASNYERGKLEWASNEFRIGTEAAGTGSVRTLRLQTGTQTAFYYEPTYGNIGIGTAGYGSSNYGQNIAIGQNALANTSVNNGQSIVAIGASALRFLNVINSTDGAVAVGCRAGNNVRAATRTVLVGCDAGTSAASYITRITNTTCVGYESGAGFDSTTITDNTLVGYRSGFALTTGSNNTLLGSLAGDAITTGSNNVVIGRDCDVDSATASNQINIGNQYFHNRTFLYNTYTDASNYERGKLEWSSNVLRIGTEKAGTGSARALELQTDGTTRLTIPTSGASTFSTKLVVTGAADPLTLVRTGQCSIALGDANGDSFRMMNAGDSSDMMRIHVTTKVVTFYGDVTISAKNIVTDTTTGTKIGTATSQKIGFWNATPIVQPTTAVGSATVNSPGGGSTIKTDDTFDGYTLQQVVKALRDTGILA